MRKEKKIKKENPFWMRKEFMYYFEKIFYDEAKKVLEDK